MRFVHTGVLPFIQLAISRLINIKHNLTASYILSLTHTPSPIPLPNVPRLVTTYSPHYTSLLASQRKHWYLVQNDPLLSALFPTHPSSALEETPPLQTHLWRHPSLDPTAPHKVRYPLFSIPRLDSRMVRCATKCYKVYPKAKGKDMSFFSMVSNTSYTFHETFTCTDTCLIYCILCNKCGKLYIGLTSNSLKVRFRIHQHASETKKLVYPVYRHFARKSKLSWRP